MQSQKKFLILGSSVIVLGLIFTRPAKALFGLDPATIQMVIYLFEIYSNAVQQFNELKLETQQIIFNAKHLTVKSALQSLGATFQRSAITSNTHGETSTWDERINGTTSPNQTASKGTWNDSTIAIENDPFISRETVGHSLRLANLAAIEISDSSAISALTTIGQTSQAQQKADNALQNIEQLSQDTTDGANSIATQLNLLSTGNVQSLRYLQTLIQIQKAQLQIDVAQVKGERDKQADIANFNTEVDKEFATTPAEWGNAAQSFQQERLP